MAREERTNADPVVVGPEQVVAAASRYGFYGAVALLERLHPDAPRVGGLGPAVEEVVRFRHDPALTFSASDVSSISLKQRRSDPTNELSPPHKYFEVVATFLGLTGAATPLPLYFAEEIAVEDVDTPAMRDFLDMFHHRLLALFYRVHAKYDYAGEFMSTADDAWSMRTLALAGVDVYEGSPATRLPRWRLLRLAPLLGQRARTKRTLEVALEDVLEDALDGAHITIEQFTGRWVEIEKRQLMKLGTVNTHLGDDTVIGVRIFDRGGKFRVVVGPLSAAAFRRFLPDGDQVPRVRDVVSLFLRDQLEFDMELVLAKNATPPLKLDMTDGSRLGHDSWLGSREHEETRVVVDVPFDSSGDYQSSDSSHSGGGANGDPPRGIQIEEAMRSSSPGSFESVEGARSYGFTSGEGHHAR